MRKSLHGQRANSLLLVSAIIIFSQLLTAQSVTGQPSKKDGWKVRVGMVAGITTTVLTIKDGTPARLDGLFKLFGGLALCVVIPKTQRSLSVTNDFFYRGYRVGASSYDKYSGPTTLQFDLAYLKLVTALRFVAPLRGKVRPFLEGGISNGWMQRADFNGHAGAAHFIIDMYIRERERGYLVGCGAIAGKVRAGLRYEITDGFAPGPGPPTACTNYYFILGYDF